MDRRISFHFLMFSRFPLGFLMDSYSEYSPSRFKRILLAGLVTYRGDGPREVLRLLRLIVNSNKRAQMWINKNLKFNFLSHIETIPDLKDYMSYSVLFYRVYIYKIGVSTRNMSYKSKYLSFSYHGMALNYILLAYSSDLNLGRYCAEELIVLHNEQRPNVN